jgi:hypothetical protein
MRLDFNVLWVEDQPAQVQAQVESIRRQMADEGFALAATICETVTDVVGKLTDNVFSDEIDLVLVDYELGGGQYGEDAIAKIRDAVRYKDVVFYSARADTNQLRELAFNNGLEGIYFCHRNDLVGEVVGVFESLIKKALDLDHIRGIVMGATSDIDQITREVLTLAHDKSSPEEQQKILEEMTALLDDKVPNLTKRIDKLKENASVPSILGAHLTFTANDGVRVLTRVLEQEKFSAQAGHRATVTKYINDVVPKRNILGHRVLSPQGKPGIAGESPTDVISFDDMKTLRKLLLDLREKFRDLQDSLGAAG